MSQNEKINEGNWLKGLARSAAGAIKNSSIASGIQSITGDSNQTQAEIVFKKRFMKRFISNIDGILQSTEKSQVSESFDVMLDRELGEAARAVRDDNPRYWNPRRVPGLIPDEGRVTPDKQTQPKFNAPPIKNNGDTTAADLIKEIKRKYPNWNLARYQEYAKRVLYFAAKPNITPDELAKKKNAIAEQLDQAFAAEDPEVGGSRHDLDNATGEIEDAEDILKGFSQEYGHADAPPEFNNPYVEAVYDTVKHVWLPGIKVNERNLIKIANLFKNGRRSQGYQNSLVKLANLVWTAANTGVTVDKGYDKDSNTNKASPENTEPKNKVKTTSDIEHLINTTPKVEQVTEILETCVKRILKLQNNNKTLTQEYLRDLIRRLN